MRAAGMTVVLSMCLLAGVVGALSLPPDDQYSPQQSPYERDVVRGPRGYQNWLEYHRNPNVALEPPENKPGIASPIASDLWRERNTQKDSAMQDLDLLPLGPTSWKVATSRVVRNFTKPEHPDLTVPEELLEIPSASQEDTSGADDTFQDQGPGSVEVYKLDLHRENALLVSQTKGKQPAVASKIKSKIPKKAKGDEILWKLKPIEASKTSLPAIFRQPPSVYRGETISRELRGKIEENRKVEVFAVGGVPELQVGCEGLEPTDRKRRSNREEDSEEEYWPRFKDPVYKESTEPILLRVTPIVLDFEDEPPAGQPYEELDELLKLKSTTPEPTTRRTNRGDIDPDLENYQHRDVTVEEKLPERGDLGPNSGKDSGRIERSIRRDDSQDGEAKAVRLTKDTNDDGKEEESHLTAGISSKDDDTLSTLIGRSESVNHPGSRKLLQYPEKEVHENRARRRHHRGVNDHEKDDLWGFAEDDGAVSGDEDEAYKLRQAETEKRRMEYERRRLEELERRRSGQGRKDDNVYSEIETIRQEYERQQEKEQRDRQRGMDERRKQEDRRRWEEEQKKTEESRRRHSEDAQRRNEEEERRNPSHSRRREQEQRRQEWLRRKEEEERQVRLEDEQSNQDPPSPLTRPSSYNQTDNRSRNRHGDGERREEEERKLREYVERNRPINVKKNEDHRRPGEHAGNSNDDEAQRKHIEEQRRRRIEDEQRRQQMEEHRRRQDSPDDSERRRQMEEERRRERPNDDRTTEMERRRQMEEQSRRERPDEDERRRQMEEQRRRERLDEDERRRQMEEQRRRERPDEDERRRQMEEQRRRERLDEDERRRQMEEQRRRERPDEDERRRQMEEQRRRDRPNDDRARDEEKKRRLEEEKKLQDYVRRNQPVNVPRRNSSHEKDWEEQRRIIDEARQWERNRQQITRKNDGRNHGPAAPTNHAQRQSQEDVEERRKFEAEGRRREEEYRRQESRRHEEERLRLEAQRRREEANRRRPNWQDSRRPTNTPHRGTEVRDRDAGELRRQETSQRLPNNSRNDPVNEWRRLSEERERQRQQQQHDERERMRIENETNSRNNGRRRPQQGNTGLSEQRGESVRSREEADRRRREKARLRALPVSARIIIRADERSSRSDKRIPPTNTRQPPSSGSIRSRDSFGNEIDFPAISPNRPGLAAARFPAPPTPRPPAKSPSACIWAIVNCCPANNRLSTCFESMGCPGGHWDPSPCRPAIESAAQEEVLSFYETAEQDYTRG